MISLESSVAPSIAASSVLGASMSPHPGAGATVAVGSSGPPISVKAVYNDQIVAFRAERGVSLTEVRAKVLDKFVKQEGVQLGDRFVLTYQPSGSSGSGVGNGMSAAKGGRARSSSVSSVGTQGSGVGDGQAKIIFSQKEWQDAVASAAAKLTLHVMDSS